MLSQGLPTPEQLGKNKVPEAQVVAVDTTWRKALQNGTPTDKLAAFQALAELVRALHGLLVFNVSDRILYCYDGPMLFLLRRALNTIPQSTPATVLRALEARGEINQSDPQLNFLIAHLCHKIIPEAGMTVLFRTDLEKYEHEGPGQSAESFGDGLVVNMVEFPSPAHREQELTRLFKHGVRAELRHRLEEIELQHPAGTTFGFHTYKRSAAEPRRGPRLTPHHGREGTQPRGYRPGSLSFRRCPFR